MHRAAGLVALALGLVAAGAASAEPPFRVFELPGPGRTAVAGFADFDGDGHTDIYSVSLYGVPPRMRRELRIHFQAADGTLPRQPGWTGDVARGAAAFDVADLPDGPGDELLLLLRHRVRVLNFAGREPTHRDIAIPGDPTVASAPDERGLDRLRMARSDVAEELRLLVPGLGDCAVLRPDGELLGRPEVGHRANYFIPPRPGPLIDESEIQKFYDFPRIDVGDVNGDGRADLVATNRHQLRVFLQRPDGRFDGPPDTHMALERLTEEDQIRGSGQVRVAARDLDGDEGLDLLVTSTTGGLLEALTETTVHLNRGGSWDLKAPDQTFSLSGSWNALQLIDLDSDGRLELVEARIPLTILELVEVLLTRALDVRVALYRGAGNGTFAEEPFLENKLDIGVEFETFSPQGFVPTLAADVNGDGRRDQLNSADGQAIEVYLGAGDQPFAKRDARQELDTRGSIRFGDLDSDGLTDFLLFDRTRNDATIRVGVNRGLLPGTRNRRILTAPPGGG